MESPEPSQAEQIALQNLVNELKNSTDNFKEISQRLHGTLAELELYKSVLASELTQEVLKKVK